MSKKALLSLLLIGILAFGAGLGTYAWFTSSATSTGNTFTAGTLKIDVNGSSDNDGTFEILSEDDMGYLLPGDEIGEKIIEISNNGNVPIAMFRQFRMSGSEMLAKNLVITQMLVEDWSKSDPWDIVGDHLDVFDFDNDGILTVYDLANRDTEISDDGWDALRLNPGETQKFTLKFKLSESAGNEVQAKKVNLKMNIEATQINLEAIKNLADKGKITLKEILLDPSYTWNIVQYLGTH